jgi:hypothetical protein
MKKNACILIIPFEFNSYGNALEENSFLFILFVLGGFNTKEKAFIGKGRVILSFLIFNREKTYYKLEILLDQGKLNLNT